MPALTPEQEMLKAAAMQFKVHGMFTLSHGRFNELANVDAILDLLARLEAVQAVPDPILQIITKHADRYLWLREEFATSAIPRVWQSNDSAEPVKCLLGEELDAAIDAEIGCGTAPGEPSQ